MWIVDKNFPRFQNIDPFTSFQKVMFSGILALPVNIKKLLAVKGLQKFNDSLPLLGVYGESITARTTFTKVSI